MEGKTHHPLKNDSSNIRWIGCFFYCVFSIRRKEILSIYTMVISLAIASFLQTISQEIISKISFDFLVSIRKQQDQRHWKQISSHSHWHLGINSRETVQHAVKQEKISRLMKNCCHEKTDVFLLNSQYVPNKPDKFCITFWILICVDWKYILNGFSYTG